MIIPEGRIMPLMFSIAVSIVLLYMVKRAEIKLPEVRKLATIDAMEDAIGRCAETGKPAHYTCGDAFLSSALAPMTFAALDILGFVARICARLGVPLIVSIMNPETIPLHEDIVYQAYLAEGKPEEYIPENIRFHSFTYSAFAAAVWAIFQNERPMSNMAIGPHRGQIYTTLESGQRVGAITIAGTARMTQVPICVVMSDYALIGEDIYAASAYYTEDITHRGYLSGQDILKMVAMIFLLIGSILSILGIETLNNLLRM